MTKISTVGNDESVGLSDRLLGTDETGKTKNYEIGAIVALVNGVSGKDYIQFKFSPTDYGSIGSFTSNSSNTNPSLVTKLFFNKKSASKEDLTALFTKLDTLPNIVIELRNPSDSNNFATFKITNITIHTEYFEFDVVLYKDFYSGSLSAGTTYSAYFDVKENFEEKLDQGTYVGTAETLKTDIETRVVKVTGSSLVEDTEITKLSHLDDTTDAQKPVSTAQAAALSLKTNSGGSTKTTQDLDNEINSILSDVRYVGDIHPSTDISGETGNIYTDVVEAGTYTNWGGIVVPINTRALLKRVGGVFSSSMTTLDLTSFASKKELYESLGEPILHSYPKDFSTLSSTATNPSSGWINNTPLLNAGKLVQLRIKGEVGAIIQPFVYSISGTEGSWIYTEEHAFNPFITTSLTHIEVINDSYVVGAGKYIGFKSDKDIYYITSGSAFNTLLPVTQSQTYSSDFVIDENVSGNINLNNEVTELKNIIGQNPILTPYSKDFSTITNQVSLGVIWINKKNIAKRGKLASFRVKVPIGSTVTPYVYTVGGTQGSHTFVENHKYASFVAESLDHTEIINDDYIVEVGQFIGYKSPNGIYYHPGSTEESYTVGSGFHDAHSFAYDFVINENTNFGLINRVDLLEEKEEQVILKPVILYRNSLANISSLTYVNWNTIPYGGAAPSTTGSANHLWLQNEYHVTPRKMSVDITLSADAVFDIHCATFSYPNGTGYYSIDVPTNSLKIYDNTRALVISGIIPFTLITGRTYVITLSIIDWLNIFEIKDKLNAVIYSLEYQIETENLLLEPRQNESYKFYQYSGDVVGTELRNMIISSKENPLIYLVGDSILEGALFATANFNKRYPIQLRKKLKGNIIISARGGATWFDVNQKLTTEVAFIKPKYIMFCIGTNTGLTEGQLTNLVNDSITLGCIPIVNHIPTCSSYVDYITVNSTIDIVCNATGAIKGCLFDVATALNNNPADGSNPAYFNGDEIHPNDLGQKKMFERFEIDLSFLFT